MKARLNYDILVRFYRGICTEEEKQKVMEWVNASSENADLFFKWEELYFLGKQPEIEDQILLRKAEKKLMGKVQAEELRKKSLSSVLRWMKYAAAVSVILTLSGLLTWYWNTEQPEWMIASTGQGESREIILPDSSRVWLNENTTLKYPQQFAAEERFLSLQGEAYFEVTKNKHKPFVVRGATMDVQVLGTKFNFYNTSDHRIAEVSLLEGEVRVKGHNNEGIITLFPGQKVMLNSVTHQMKVTETDAALDAVWHDNLIPFKNADIFKIANVLEKLYHVKVILSPDLNHTATYSGMIRRKDSVEEVLWILKNTMHLQYKINNGTIFITSNEK